MVIVCSSQIRQYFDSLTAEVTTLHKIANQARAKNLDPEPFVDIPLAASVAQRVEALIASVKPELLNSGLSKRIEELEKKYSPGDWRIALLVAAEVAEQKFCQFTNIKDAIEVGTRVGFAYITLGVVAAPLEGLVEMKLKKRLDGKDYLALYFAGPVRAAGGTAEAVAIVIADYVRRKFGIADYDPTDEEVKRYQVEIDDYLTKVAHRQYKPSAEELEMMVRGIKVEITGDPTEKFEVSQCKRLPRVETDTIRGGMALVMTEGPSLKASKLWKQLSKWGKDFGLEDWSWLKDFIALKEKLHSAKAEEEGIGAKPVDTYLSDLVAGRPIFSYPMRSGGFRLRYGRCRFSGFAATAIHPATMQILNDYVATGTQIKMERPGKATVFAPCDSIDGPIVMLEDGSVLYLSSEVQARAIRRKIKEIIFIGDLLVNYGDFSENGQRLVPAGYCEEWWEQEYEKATGKKAKQPESTEEALKISEETGVPLHPKYTYYWSGLSADEFKALHEWFKKLDGNSLPADSAKRYLELIGCPHKVVDGRIVLDGNELAILKYLLKDGFAGNNGLECINSISKVKIRDKAGTFIGTRMGRPEKAKMRKLKGSPAVLFPVGKEGGRLRSLTAAIEKQEVTSDFPIRECNECQNMTIYPSCELCGAKTETWRVCPLCKRKTKKLKCHTDTVAYEKRKINVSKYFDAAVKSMNVQQLPPLIKGVRGTWNKDHILENLSKGILRAMHKLTINKDGTIRYDMTEMGCTHFKASEIDVSVEKLKQLGYTTDKDGLPLESENQIVEIRPQDVILPSCPEAAEEGADKVLIRICGFVDDLLEKFYGLQRYYNVKTRADLIGHLVIGLAPHTSGGTIGRIIGFSKTQGCFAHPYWHAAQRRNFDGDETCIILALEAFLNFSRQYLPDRRGGRAMDAPLVLTTVLDPTEVDTEVHGMDIVSYYPLEFYEAALKNAWPWEVSIEQVKSRLGKQEQYEGIKYTRESTDLNAGVRYSAYKSIPTMLEKLEGQLDLSRKLRGVSVENVAALVIDKHFIRDIKGNLRKFTQQEFRCVVCNNKYRRPPLAGTCTCGGRLLFTISEGTIKKYLDASMKLVSMPGVPNYLKQSMEILKRRIESIFGKEQTKQIELKQFFGG